VSRSVAKRNKNKEREEKESRTEIGSS